MIRYENDIYQTEDIAEVIAKMYKKKKFDGVIASEDALALGALKFAIKAGLEVPKDLSIIGYNNSVLSTCSTPTLTSIDNKLENQTHQLVQTLMGVLNGNSMPKKIVFSGNLISRDTTIF